MSPVDPYRRIAAQQELGKRHPYRTLYGGVLWSLAWIGMLIVGIVLGVRWAARHMPSLGGGWLIPLLVIAVVGAVLWIVTYFSPMSRKMRGR